MILQLAITCENYETLSFLLIMIEKSTKVRRDDLFRDTRRKWVWSYLLDQTYLLCLISHNRLSFLLFLSFYYLSLHF